MELWKIIISGIFTLAATLATVIPTIIATRKKTEEAVKSAATEAVKSATAETNKRIDNLQSTLDAHIREDEETNARNRRYRILRFNDEICVGAKHSESHFEDILEDCDAYAKFCDAHRQDFKNHRGQAAVRNIKDTYETLKSSGTFEIKG